MSQAGALSNRGDYYQILIAEHWLIRLLQEPEIEFVQVDSTGLPGKPDQVSVDDIVVRYKNGHSRFIQGKKNQQGFKPWSLTQLKSELVKADTQLQSEPNADIEFVSRSSFGDLQKIAESCTLHPGYSAFTSNAPTSHKRLDVRGIEEFLDLSGTL